MAQGEPFISYKFYLVNGIIFLTLPSLSHIPPQINIPTYTGNRVLESKGMPTLRLVSIAPPKYPVKSIAPKIEVLGMLYRAKQINSIIPIVTAMFRGSPSWLKESTTGWIFNI